MVRAKRQEVVNTVLAQVLQQRGLIAAPELILPTPLTGRTALPDVIVDFNGLRLAIEAEFSSTRNAERAAYDAAQERVENGIAHIGMAVIYPVDFRTLDFESLPSAFDTN